MVKNRAAKAVARRIKADSEVTYPRALAAVMSTDAAVQLHGQHPVEHLGFSLEQDRNLIVTGSREDRSATFGNTLNRFAGSPATIAIIDLSREHLDFFVPELEGIGSSQGWYPTVEEAVQALEEILAVMDSAVSECQEHGVDSVELLRGFSAGDRIVLCINDVPGLLAASPECADALARITHRLDGNRVHLMVCGDDLSTVLAPGAKKLKTAARLHFGSLANATGIPAPLRNAWEGLCEANAIEANSFYEKANGSVKPFLMHNAE